MVLNLIMTMLDKLGPTILQNPTQIIAFASNVIDSHLMQTDHQSSNEPTPTMATQGGAGLAGIANLVSQEDYQEEAVEDDDAAIMEDDLGTLFLAVNLLGAVLNGMCYNEYSSCVIACKRVLVRVVSLHLPPKNPKEHKIAFFFSSFYCMYVFLT